MKEVNKGFPKSDNNLNGFRTLPIIICEDKQTFLNYKYCENFLNIAL